MEVALTVQASETQIHLNSAITNALHVITKINGSVTNVSLMHI